MKKFLTRGASVFTVGLVSLALTATTVAAGGRNDSSEGHRSGGLAAALSQKANNSNATSQSGSASVDNSQKNTNWPVSIFSVGSSHGPSKGHPSYPGGDPSKGHPSQPGSGCGCQHTPPKPPKPSKPASGGDVKQSNNADNTATSTVTNGTTQGVTQTGTATATGTGNGHGKGGNDTTAGVKQQAGNSNSTSQQGGASVDNDQKNTNKPVSVGTVGSNGGDVKQSNDADNTAKSTVTNGTTQGVTQTGTATATNTKPATPPSHSPYDPCGCDGHSTGDTGKGDKGHGKGGSDTSAGVKQDGGNSNSTQQQGSASVDNDQSNVNKPVAIGTVGSNGGDVKQSNDADNTAKSTVTNGTTQGVTQTGTATATSTTPAPAPAPHDPCGCDGHSKGDKGKGDKGKGDNVVSAVVNQVAGNSNSTSQSSNSSVKNSQTNINAPITLFSVDSNNGDVHQGNNADNSASSNVGNTTNQNAQQTGNASASGNGGHGSGDAKASTDQSADNGNSTDQHSAASVDNDQLNVNAPITLFSVGSGNGDVHQSNNASNSASSNVSNGTAQGITQIASGVSSLLG